MTTKPKPVFRIGDFSVVAHEGRYAILGGATPYEVGLSRSEAKLVAIRLHLVSCIDNLSPSATKKALTLLQGL